MNKPSMGVYSKSIANPQEILRKVRRIEISTRKIIENLLSDRYRTRFKGQGMQFSDFREYYPGDDIRHIDWKVTARTQTVHIRKFEEERDLTLYLMVDVSQSGEFGSGQKTKAEALAEVCALIAFAAIQNNDKVGLILFSDKIEKHIRPRKGRAHAMRLVTEILYHRPQSSGTNIKAALEYYARVMKHSAVVFLASDFLDQGYEKMLRRVGKKHDLIALRMCDSRETQAPPLGALELYDPESGEVFLENLASYSFQKNFKATHAAFEKNLDTVFYQAGVDRLDLWTHEDYFGKVVSYFKARKKIRSKK